MRAPHRAGRAAAGRYREHLSERDLALLASVGRYRYLSARQIEELHFFDLASPLTCARTCRRVLERLSGCGVLWRLARRIGGIRAGSASYVYALTPLGYRVLNDAAHGHVRRHEPSEEFLDHTLAIAQLAVDVQKVARRSDEVDVLEMAPEPECWRRFSAGLEGTLVLKPDMSLAVRVAEYELHWFIEIDRGTHSAASVVRKCRLYHRYWSTGIEQDACGLFPQVLFSALSLRRATLLERAIGAAHHLNHDLFVVTTTDKAVAQLTGALS